MSESALQLHNIPPVYDEHSARLILGSFPSVLSRRTDFFYGHPQNRFWKVLAKVFDCKVPVTVAEKRQLVLSHHLALFDVIASCEIAGSADSAIKNVVPSHLSPILNNSKITEIFVNGKTAEKYYNKYLRSETGIDCICLPSTSPANAAFSLDKLVESWKIIAE